MGSTGHGEHPGQGHPGHEHGQHPGQGHPGQPGQGNPEQPGHEHGEHPGHGEHSRQPGHGQPRHPGHKHGEHPEPSTPAGTAPPADSMGKARSAGARHPGKRTLRSVPRMVTAITVGIIAVVVVSLLAVHLAAAPKSATPPANSAASTHTAAAAAASTHTAAAPAIVTSIVGNYTFTRQVISCTGGGGTCPPITLPMTIRCPASGSCVASSSHWGSSHAVTFNGTTISFSGIDVGVAGACGNTPMPATLTFDLTVVSWKVGSDSVRRPQRIQGPYSFSAAAAGGCASITEKAIITFG